MNSIQLSLFDSPQASSQDKTSEWGTFKDSMKAPIHSWFAYPAGFSYKAVRSSFHQYKITQGNIIYDPFMGSGTTNIVAQEMGINSYGVEAHPFVFEIAKTKMNWSIEHHKLLDALKSIENQFYAVKSSIKNSQKYIEEQQMPELVLKCYETKTLLDLLIIRNIIIFSQFSQEVKSFFRTALTFVLRQVSSAATGWPYIAPNKKKLNSLNKKSLDEFIRTVYKMLDDIKLTIKKYSSNRSQCWFKLYNQSSNNTSNIIPSESIDHIFTSPPYLNNFDYADRTRLELYFFGEAKKWSDITHHFRSKLMTSATTQVTRNNSRFTLSENLYKDCPESYQYLSLENQLEQIWKLLSIIYSVNYVQS